MIKSTLVIALGLLAGCNSKTPSTTACENTKSIKGLFIDIPAGTLDANFTPLYPEEYRREAMSIEGFKIQAHEVTNEQFTEFVEATGYITDAEQTRSEPGASGSALFSQQEDQAGGWTLINGATWQQPDGPDSNLDGKEHHPVVHVSYQDASRYAQWRGGRLPTELEWEYAASLGLRQPGDRYSGAFDDEGNAIANTWQGLFPVMDSGDDGFTSTSPVGCFEPNKIGLFDMIGNVWEWTDTIYQRGHHTIKGGSFLCAQNYCKRYRPEARQPHESDFSTNHIGFRIIKDS